MVTLSDFKAALEESMAIRGLTKDLKTNLGTLPV